MNEGLNKTYEFDCSNDTSALYVHLGAFSSPSVRSPEFHSTHVSEAKNKEI